MQGRTSIFPHEAERAIKAIAKVTDYALDGKQMMSEIYVWIGSLARAVERADSETQERLYKEMSRYDGEF